jgi:hypothetical protein
MNSLPTQVWRPGNPPALAVTAVRRPSDLRRHRGLGCWSTGRKAVVLLREGSGRGLVRSDPRQRMERHGASSTDDNAGDGCARPLGPRRGYKTTASEIRALLRAHLAAASGYRHVTRRRTVRQRLQQRALEVTGDPLPVRSFRSVRSDPTAGSFRSVQEKPAGEPAALSGLLSAAGSDDVSPSPRTRSPQGADHDPTASIVRLARGVKCDEHH